MMASLAELTDNPFVQNTIDSVALRDATDLPKTRIIVRPQNTPDNEPVKQDDSKLQNIIDQLFGLNGKERYQLWPEKLVRDAISAPHDVMTGEIPQYVIDPITGEARTSPQMIKAGVDTSSLAGSGGLAGAGSEAGVALGSAPFLRPALKYGEKLYKGKPGQQHMDVIPADLYPTFQKQAMSGEDISNFNFGFLNHKGQFLSREDALKYAIDNGLVDPHSAQYGALTSTLMSDTSKPGAALAAVANTNKPFYSAVENAVAAAKQPKADVQQWISFLKNQPGVKQEELAHLGLDKLQGSISKDDLLKAVQEGQPQIKEVVKSTAELDKAQKELETAIGSGIPWGKGKLYSDEVIRGLVNEDLGVGDLPANLQPLAKNLLKANKESVPPKFKNYQLPGGENYREMLLTLPVKTSPKAQEALALTKRMNDGEFNSLDDAGRKALFAKRDQLLREAKAEEGSAYKSSHWDEPNVLAHIRMNDRTIDGKKSLHLEEIQSDWHQAGRKQGYQQKINPDEITLKKVQSTVPEGHDPSNYPGYWESFDKNGNLISRHRGNSTETEAKSEAIKSAELNNKSLVPDAPFKKTWDELALKKAITEAVKNGYDQISWTPGEAQAARYDLSKQVDSIKYLKNDDGTYNIVPFKNDRPVHSVEAENVKPEKLPDIVGKEVAEKITNGHGAREKGASDIRVLSGQDLKVGGQGMKAFYDKMLVDKMNALTKKYGGKVEKGKLPLAPKGKTYKEILEQTGYTDEQWKSMTPSERQTALNKANIGHDVHILKITPALREQVLKKGFPLFSAGVPIFTPVEGNPFESK